MSVRESPTTASDSESELESGNETKHLDVAGRVAAMRARFDDVCPPNDDDLADMVDHATSTTRLLDDVWEVVRQLFAGGVAYPDPDMPAELVVLLDRAERHGLPTAVALIGALSEGLKSLGEQTDLFARADGSEAVWLGAQRLLAWLRLFRQEHDLTRVQGGLAREARTANNPPTAPKRSRVPVASLTCWPVGLMRRGTKLTIFALDIDVPTGSDMGVSDRRPQRVMIVDELPDVPTLGPFSGLVISRLFRDQLSMASTMSGLIRLTEHPVVVTGSSDRLQRLFRPAFTATATRVPAARSFVAPALPSIRQPQRGREGPTLGTAEIVAVLDAAGDVTLRWPQGLTVGVHVGDALRFNLLKLMAREGERALHVSSTLHRPGGGDGGFVLLAMTTDLDGRTFPVDDPRAIQWQRSLVADWAAESVEADLTVDAGANAEARWSDLLLRAGAFLHGGAGHDAMTPFRVELAKFKTQKWARLQTLNAIRWAFGDAPMELKGAVRRAVSVLRAAQSIKRPASKGYIASDAVFGALAAILDYGAGAVLEDATKQVLEALLGGRYAAMSDWSWTDICCRGLLMALTGESGVAAGFAEPESPPDAAGEADEADEALQQPPTKAEKTAAVEDATDSGVAGALTFLDAHLDGLRRPRKESAPSPDGAELLRVAYTVRVLTGIQVHEPALETLDLPWHLVPLMVATTVCRWRLPMGPVAGGGGDQAVGVRARVDAGTALLVGLESGLSDLWMTG